MRIAYRIDAIISAPVHRAQRSQMAAETTSKRVRQSPRDRPARTIATAQLRGMAAIEDHRDIPRLRRELRLLDRELPRRDAAPIVRIAVPYVGGNDALPRPVFPGAARVAAMAAVVDNSSVTRRRHIDQLIVPREHAGARRGGAEAQIHLEAARFERCS